MPLLLILKGPPATGKSTYRKSVIDANPHYRYVNLDELRLQYPDKKEREIQDIQRQLVEHFKQGGYSIIIDNTNLNPNTLQHWINWAQSNYYDCEIKEFGHDVSWQDAIQRDFHREHPVGRSVIIQMYMDAGLFMKYPKQNAVIFDLDGTLCNLEHRRHFVRGEGKKDWKSFFGLLSKDTPNNHVKLVYGLIVTSNEYDYTYIIFLSGRPSEYRKQTEQWLQDHGFGDYFALFMRPFNNKEDDSVIKEQLYRKYVEPYFNVQFVLDDRNRVVEMWRRIGLHCFQVADGDF